MNVPPDSSVKALCSALPTTHPDFLPVPSMHHKSVFRQATEHQFRSNATAYEANRKMQVDANRFEFALGGTNRGEEASAGIENVLT